MKLIFSSCLYPICDNPMPLKFSNPDEASTYLEIISAECFDFFDDLWMHSYQVLAEQENLENLSLDQQNCLVRTASRTVEVGNDLTEGIEKCRESLHSWNAAFSGTQQTEKNIMSHISTQIFYFCISVWVETWRDSSSMDVDRFGSQFEVFSSLCEQYLRLHVAKTPTRSTFMTSRTNGSVRLDTPPAFSLGSGMVTCLVIIVERCRDSLIRRRCINVLQRINLRGIFDIDYLVAYLQAIVEHEAGLTRLISHHLSPDLRVSDIPEAARFLEVVMSPSYHASNFEFYKQEHVGMVYVTGGHGIDGNGLRLGEKEIQMFTGGEIGSLQMAHSSTPLTAYWDISF
jgi:hypothetical protein